MLELSFHGWFQCRLATDPDAFDDPRGQRGWTFAMPGEPDLDRIIRFQNAVAPRTHGPTIGVGVDGVRKDGQPVTSHPLSSGAVEFINQALFDGRNGQIATAANEPIVPFDLRVSAGTISLTGHDPIDLANPAEL